MKKEKNVNGGKREKKITTHKVYEGLHSINHRLRLIPQSYHY